MPETSRPVTVCWVPVIIAQVFGHDLTIGAGIDLTAGLLGHLEARPTLAYRELADPKAGRRGEFSLAGHVEISAQPFLALAGKAWIRLSSPWWSPAPIACLVSSSTR